LFSTRYLPLGETAGMAQLRTGLPTEARLSTGTLLMRSNVVVTVSPPMTSVEPFAETVWHVLQASFTPAAARKSSGALAPGLMRTTRPRLLDQ
jgi:hypothetical protein